jgi:8-oxo-dGTP diphosphatase
MNHDTATPYIASYVLIEKDGKYAFVLRKSTGWMDDFYGLPSGKVEHAEPYTLAAVREAKEEIGVTILSENLTFIHVMHRNEGSEWVDVYFRANKWSGEAANAEPEKHGELAWFTLEELPENTIPSVRAALKHIAAGKQFSEYGWEN